jgi:hypothetical protein
MDHELPAEPVTGGDLFRELLRRGVALAGRSGFVAALLEMEDS